MAAGTYGVPYLFVRDDAGNQADTWFSAPAPDTHEVAAAHQPLVTIAVDTADADVTPPEIDVNRIAIRGAPTKPHEPHAPDGETLVRTSPRQTAGSGSTHLTRMHFCVFMKYHLQQLSGSEAVFLRSHGVSSVFRLISIPLVLKWLTPSLL
jgi:hypothetical protein